jgi:hypothetical protein
MNPVLEVFLWGTILGVLGLGVFVLYQRSQKIEGLHRAMFAVKIGQALYNELQSTLDEYAEYIRQGGTDVSSLPSPLSGIAATLPNPTKGLVITTADDVLDDNLKEASSSLRDLRDWLAVNGGQKLRPSDIAHYAEANAALCRAMSRIRRLEGLLRD